MENKDIDAYFGIGGRGLVGGGPGRGGYDDCGPL